MSKIIEFPNEKNQSVDEFVKEQFDLSKLEGVKGVVAGLLMENGKIDLIVTGMNWKKVLWVATQIINFASQCEEE